MKNPDVFLVGCEYIPYIALWENAKIVSNRSFKISMHFSSAPIVLIYPFLQWTSMTINGYTYKVVQVFLYCES